MGEAVAGVQIELGGLVAFVGSVVAIIVWLVRLEGKVNSQDRDSVRIETRTVALETAVVQRLSAMERSLAKIEGRLSIESNDRD